MARGDIVFNIRVETQQAVNNLRALGQGFDSLINVETLGSQAKILFSIFEGLSEIYQTARKGAQDMRHLGGSFEVTAREFDEFDANVQEAKNNLMSYLVDAVLPIVRGYNTWVEETAALDDQHAKWAQQMGMNVTPAVVELDDAVYQMTQSYIDAHNAGLDVINSSITLEKTLVSSANEAAEMADAFGEEVVPVYAELKKGAGEAEQAHRNWLDALDTDVSSTVGGMLDDLDFFLSGGAELDAAAGAIKDSLLAGEITPEEAKGYFEQLFVETEELKVKMGEISEFEAAANIRDQLGVPFQEARDLMDDIVDAGSIIQSMESHINFRFTVTGDALALMVAESLFLGGVIGQLNFPLGGGLGSANPGTGSTPGGAPGGPRTFAEGADFIVPPGYPNDSFGPMYAQSGERVQVTPRNETPSSVGQPIILVTIDGQQIAAHAQNVMGADARSLLANGGIYTGA